MQHIWGRAEQEGRIVFDNVTITHRGARYEIGRGRDFYGIWAVGTTRSHPLEQWPETPEGWSAAWSRFTEIEAPGTIGPVGQRAGGLAFGTGAGAGRGGVIAALLLAVGVAFGVAGLFPGYIGGQSLAQESVELVPHIIYLVAWSLSAVLILLGGARLRVGALLGLGMSIVTFGLFFADLGEVIAGGSHLMGAGLWLSLVGWLFCAAGSALAFRLRPEGVPGRLGKLRGSEVGPVGLLVLAGLGAAIAFAPSWDTYTLRTATASQSIAEGNAFSNPGAVIAGDVMVMVALALVVIAAALWRPIRHGAALLAGAIIPMAAQAISALIQVAQPTSPTQFGISSAQASQLGLTISNGVTVAFWIYCLCVLVLLVSCAWMVFTPHQPTGLYVDAPNAGPPSDAETQGVWYAAGSGLDDTGDLQSPAARWQRDEDGEDASNQDEVPEALHVTPTPSGAREDDGGPAA
jgi:hypothetical protein